jgi:hypothetical protein
VDIVCDNNYTVKRTDAENRVLAKQLLKDGFVVIPVLTAAGVRHVRTEFEKSMEAFPEYSRGKTPGVMKSGKPMLYVAGGFGALGNPASFHDEFARWVREAQLAATIPMFRQYVRLAEDRPREWGETTYDPSTRKIFTVMERNMVRQVGTDVTSEEFHRDQTPAQFIREGDEVFGCMLNVSETANMFGCMRGTHKSLQPWEPSHDARSGFKFVQPSEEEVAALYVDVPYGPGEAVVFFQHIMHNVKPQGKLKRRIHRLLTAMWLTSHPDPPPFDLALEDQGVPQIKSGQRPTMFSKNHRSGFLNKQWTYAASHKTNLIEWSRDAFRPGDLEHITGKTGASAGVQFDLVPEVFPSLVSKGIAFRGYDPLERGIFLPHKSHALRSFETMNVACRTNYTL